MALGQGINFPYFNYFPAVTPAGGSKKDGDDNQNDENVFAKQQEQLEQEAKKSQEEFLARLELVKLKQEHADVTKNLQQQQYDAERAYRVFQKSKNQNGEGRLDSGKGGFLRWLSNAGTSLVNLGKSIIGFDKDGKWNPLKCLKNVVVTAAAIGACFIPVVGPAIGYGLLATGVIGGAVGVAKGVSKLNEAELSGDQRKIDEAQQDICGNAFIGITSAFGLRGVGAGFRTSAATAELASSATARTGLAGRTVESLSNFGRDVTVNALRSTKHSAAAGTVPSLMRFRGWDKQYRVQRLELQKNLNQKIAEIDRKMLAETDPAKQVLLQEQKQMLEANLSEINQIGTRVRTKEDFDKLANDNMAKTNEEYIQDGFGERIGITDNGVTNYGYNVNGTLVREQEFLNFQRMVIRQQRAIDKELKALTKAKENMMRTFEKSGKHRAELEKYISDGKIGGKNPRITKGLWSRALTSPASTAPKAIGMWVDPLYSGAAGLTVDLSKEDTQAQLDAMQMAIDTIKSRREELENASTFEEFNIAMAHYNQLLLAASGEADVSQQPDGSQPAQQQ